MATNFGGFLERCVAPGGVLGSANLKAYLDVYGCFNFKTVNQETSSKNLILLQHFFNLLKLPYLAGQKKVGNFWECMNLIPNILVQLVKV